MSFIELTAVYVGFYKSDTTEGPILINTDKIVSITPIEAKEHYRINRSSEIKTINSVLHVHESYETILRIIKESK